MISETPLTPEMPPTKKEKITFTCTTDTREVLQEWADKDGRTLSNLVERIVLAAIEQQQGSDRDE